jgi:putative transposase
LAEKKAATLPYRVRRALIEQPADTLALTTQAALLTISRTHLYYQSSPPSAREVAIKHRLDELFTACPFYGSRKLQVLLVPEFGSIARNTVRRYMHEMGISAVYPGPNLSQPHPDHRVYPYLLRNVTASYPNHVWGVDITYVRLRGGWLYLVAVLDWFSRYVVSWALDDTLEIGFVLAAVEQALALATPTIWNSDQGSHFTSPQYTQRLAVAGVQISMDGRGRALDNIFTERFWRSLKYEEVYLHEYGSPRDARQGITRYMGLYNHERPHQALDYRTPAALYFAPPPTGRGR